MDETRDFWNRIVGDWRIQVGDDGDLNRQLNSGPVIWEFLGDVRGRTVLDAGCGVGYLSRQLAAKGATVIGVDFAERMVADARAHYPEIDFRVDSCSDLASIPDASCELIVSNYVLMDTPDLEGTLQAFHRVLKPEGTAVVVFSHPCFPGSRAEVDGALPRICYRWEHSYFERRREVDPPWHHFTAEFVWFHRPLSDYWKAFVGARFSVEAFEEPRLTEQRFHLAPSEAELDSSRSKPLSVAFKLRKGG